MKYRKSGVEILNALKELGPSTVAMLELFTGMKKANIRHALMILHNKGLVDMLVGNEKTFFYQLNQSFAARSKAASQLGCSDQELKKPLLRRQDRYHNQWCEYWSWILRSSFPDVIVVRDYDLQANEIAKNVLLTNHLEPELLPDFLAIFPNEDKHRTVIAFEIERTRKSEKRLINKFRRYMEETRLDGIVYVCDTGRLAETLRAIYESKLVDKAERIQNYVHNFFLFSNSFSAGSQPLKSFFNVNGDHVSLFDWCDALKTNSRNKRRDADFKKL